MTDLATQERAETVPHGYRLGEDGERRSRRCACGCEEPIFGRPQKRYASDTCRSRARRERAPKPSVVLDLMRRSVEEHASDPAALAAELRAEANRLMAGQWVRDEAGRFAGRR